MKDYAIIVAAGSGSRMKSALPKQFLELDGKPILLHTMEKFHRFNPGIEIIVVLNSEYIQFWEELQRMLHLDIPHTIVAGGKERFHSVKKAVDQIDANEGIVGVHDAVRPLVSLHTLEACYSTARSRSNAVPVIHPSDSLRIVEDNHNTGVDRSKYRMVQTPQCFEVNLLKKAYQQEYQTGFTDDASVVEFLGEKIHLVEGNRENIKITTIEDLRMAEALLST